MGALKADSSFDMDTYGSAPQGAPAIVHLAARYRCAPVNSNASHRDQRP